MELPTYHWPTFTNVMRSMWERGWSFIKKAGTIILLSTIVIWFLSFFGWGNMAAAFTAPAGLSFLIFNLLCAPCFAAIGAIKREMNSRKWTWAAIGYQCGFAYVVSFVVYQLGKLFTGNANRFGTILAFAVIVCFVWLLFRKPRPAVK